MGAKSQVNVNMEPRTEPTVRADQDEINRYYDMVEGETAIAMFLEDYKRLFPEEIKSFLLDLRLAVIEENDDDDDDDGKEQYGLL